MAPLYRIALLTTSLSAPAAGLAKGEDLCPSGACDATRTSSGSGSLAPTEALLIQTRRMHTARSSAVHANTTSPSAQESYCRVGDAVRCPGSSDTWCRGEECCPGEDGGPNHPCPSAPSGWGFEQCQSSGKKYDCTDGWQCIVGEMVQCPGSGIWCNGEECCPGVDGAPNFPCPSAPKNWGEGMCQTGAKKEHDCTHGKQCREGEDVQCPGTKGHLCRGEQCCPGVAGGSNFPCPSAPNGWGDQRCESATKAHDCTTEFRCSVGEAVQCPGSGVWCSGEECCPAAEGEDNFPCPSAPSGWGLGKCQASKKWDCTPPPLLA